MGWRVGGLGASIHEEQLGGSWRLRGCGSVGQDSLEEADSFGHPHLCTGRLWRSQVDDGWAQGSSGGIEGSEMASGQAVNCPALG